MSTTDPHSETDVRLDRQFGLVGAIAFNITMMVGSGVFLSIPLMIGKLPGEWHFQVEVEGKKQARAQDDRATSINVVVQEKITSQPETPE